MAETGGIKGNWTDIPYSKVTVEPLRDLNNHHDLSASPSSPGNSTDRWKWDNKHVRMPCSPYNVDRDGVSRWSVIKRKFEQTVYTSGYLLGDMIKSYNAKYAATWRFNCLEEFSKQDQHLFATVVPEIIDLAMKLPELIHQPIPILHANQESSVTLTQMQIASLLANAFLCTFPWRNDPNQSGVLPTINFNTLFEQNDQSAVEKIKCIFHYFRRVSRTRPTGKVTFTRCVLNNKRNWRASTKPLQPLKITDFGNIEDDGESMLQVIFANKMIGGGVLGCGTVQEGIRFAISPELIVAKLFTEELQDNEALVVTGTERFNKHSGYAQSFRYDGDFQDNTPVDQDGRRRCSIVAIDAIHFNDPKDQYSIDMVNRELNKAYAGFRLQNDVSNRLSPIATGNWGCGAFNGDPRLKALIQLMAASQAGRKLRYFTYGDQALAKEMVLLCGFLDAYGVKTVGALYKNVESILSYNSTNVLADLVQLVDAVRDQPAAGPSNTSGQNQASYNGPHSIQHQGPKKTPRPQSGHQNIPPSQTHGPRNDPSTGKTTGRSTPTFTVARTASSASISPELPAAFLESTSKTSKDGQQNVFVYKKGSQSVNNVTDLLAKYSDLDLKSSPTSDKSSEYSKNKEKSESSQGEIGQNDAESNKIDE